MTHSRHRSPAEILMYGRASGGSTPAVASLLPDNKPHFRGGGNLNRPKSYMKNGRRCHAEGDLVGTGELGVNPVNGYKYPESPEAKRRGGRARYHAEGDSVYAEGDSVPYRRGGRTRRAEGDLVGYAEGDSVYAEDDSVSHRRGGRARYHAEGDTVGYAEGTPIYAESDSVPYRRGGRTHKRRHHAEGDSVDEDMEKRSGEGRMSEGGETSEYKKRGGRMHHRQHHNFGDFVKKVGNGVMDAATTFGPLALALLKKGGPAHRHRRRHAEGEEVPLKRAMGGVGKLRKGML